MKTEKYKNSKQRVKTAFPHTKPLCLAKLSQTPAKGDYISLYLQTIYHYNLSSHPITLIILHWVVQSAVKFAPVCFDMTTPTVE